MPPDIQHDSQRKLGRKGAEEGEGSHSREIELKRSKGEISCAECRRCVLSHYAGRILLTCAIL